MVESQVRGHLPETLRDHGELKSGVSAYFNFYNSARFHQSLDYSVPDEMYESFQYNGLEYKQAV